LNTDNSNKRKQNQIRMKLQKIKILCSESCRE